MKQIYIKKLVQNKVIEESFMVLKKLSLEEDKQVAILGDKTGDIKAYLKYDKSNQVYVGDIIKAKCKKSEDGILDVESYTKLETYNIEDYLPTVDRPIEDIMKELEQISTEEFKSEEVKALNNYFFGNNEFVDKFKKGIGGLVQHHNYIGGLAEHTLNVMYLAKVMAYRYDCRNKEIAILAAKLHDIGKIQEYNVNGPFSVTTEGSLQGHIVIGITMIEEAFRAGGQIYSEKFKQRIKGCIVQHHGKVEYGSPVAPNSEEAYIVHFADYVDATMNKVYQIKKDGSPNQWSQYDRRVGTRLLL